MKVYDRYYSLCIRGNAFRSILYTSASFKCSDLYVKVTIVVMKIN